MSLVFFIYHRKYLYFNFFEQAKKEYIKQPKQVQQHKVSHTRLVKRIITT